MTRYRIANPSIQRTILASLRRSVRSRCKLYNVSNPRQKTLHFHEHGPSFLSTRPLSISTAQSDAEDRYSKVVIEDVHSIDGIQPLVKLENGQTQSISSESASLTSSVVKRIGDHYSCACPAWRMQEDTPIDARTCKHLTALLGNNYEEARLSAKGVDVTTIATKVPAKQKTKEAQDMPTILSPPKKSKGTEEKADVKVLLANKYNFEKMKPDPKGLWVSEKLDGVRVLWDGQGRLLSRNGGTFYAPRSFTEYLPQNEQLDGELFMDRNSFSKTVSVVRAHDSPRWNEITFMVFDIPSQSDKPFEQRMSHLQHLFPQAPRFEIGGTLNIKGKDNVTLVDHVECESPEHLKSLLERVQRVGGEGLMLRTPKSKYEFKRSSTLLKVKTFYDAEATIVGYEPGKGKYNGLVGSLVCKMQCGKEFSVGSGLSDADRNEPPAIGSIITYRFQELTKSGVPRFPSYQGPAIDKDGPKDAEIRQVDE